MAENKEIASLIQEIQQSKTVHIDEDGYARIRISVSDDSNFLSPFSADDQAVISGDTAQSIEHFVKHVPPKANLHFVFRSAEIDQEERKIYDGAIRNYYRAECIEICREMRRNAIQTVIMVCMAGVVFAAALALDGMRLRPILTNMLDVVAWVFMWEAVDVFVFQRSALRVRRMRFLKIIQSKISFESASENETHQLR